MTAADRKAVAETLREWAAWCEVNPDCDAADACGTPEIPPSPYVDQASDAATPWCVDGFESGRLDLHTGPTAATGLLLAAAMVEAGDGV